jgi:putative ABC transport system permease protein
MQFIMESVTLSVVGGLLGVLIGVVCAMSIAHMVQWSTSISPVAVAVSFGISAAVGIFFGYYPARQASQVAPLSSLRYE